MCLWIPCAAQETAALSGVVETASQPARPLAHAVVSLGGRDLPVRLSVIADERGQFTFVDLAPGVYAVTAAKPGYVPSAHGARRVGDRGTPVTLTAGARLNDVRVRLVEAATVAGRIRDPSGAPAGNIAVAIVPAAAAMGPMSYASRPDALITDASGAYRADQLAPGEYLIVAGISDDLNRRPVYRPTAAEIDASLFALQQRTTGGTTPFAAMPTGPPNLRTYGWAPIFYPGTTDVQQARRVQVRAGETRRDLDFTVDLAPFMTVAGAVVAADGTPTHARVSITPIGPSLPVEMVGSLFHLLRPTLVHGGAVRLMDEFSFSGLPPGTYLLTARERDAWAVTNVVVRDGDIKDLRLPLQPSMALSGGVVFEGSASAPPADPAAVRLGLELSGVPAHTPAGATPGRLLGISAPEPVAPDGDGRFSISGILPGTYALSATSSAFAAGRTWWPRSATSGGRDLLDMPLRFGTELRTVDDVVLTLSDRPGELTGRLLTAAGAPAPEYSVILFSADRAHWFPGARRTRAVRPATDGTFLIGELPAGEYFLAALTDAEPGVWDQAAFLEQIARAALGVSIGDGARVRQDLQIAVRH
jgi:protocatechuate 3,4-dioxygenase beta subunit